MKKFILQANKEDDMDKKTKYNEYSLKNISGINTPINIDHEYEYNNKSSVGNFFAKKDVAPPNMLVKKPIIAKLATTIDITPFPVLPQRLVENATNAKLRNNTKNLDKKVNMTVELLIIIRYEQTSKIYLLELPSYILFQKA